MMLQVLSLRLNSAFVTLNMATYITMEPVTAKKIRPARPVDKIKAEMAVIHRAVLIKALAKLAATSKRAKAKPKRTTAANMEMAKKLIRSLGTYNRTPPKHIKRWLK